MRWWPVIAFVLGSCCGILCNEIAVATGASVWLFIGVFALGQFVGATVSAIREMERE